MDYQVNYKLSEDYFNKVIAPQKELYIMNNTTHALMISKSQEFSDILHDINKKFKRQNYEGKFTESSIIENEKIKKAVEEEIEEEIHEETKRNREQKRERKNN